MTHFTNQAELNLMNETELHLQLRETFNAMVNFERVLPEYAKAAATLQEIPLGAGRNDPASRRAWQP